MSSHDKDVPDTNKENNCHHCAGKERFPTCRRNARSQLTYLAAEDLSVQYDVPNREDKKQDSKAAMCRHPSMICLELTNVAGNSGDEQAKAAEQNHNSHNSP